MIHLVFHVSRLNEVIGYDDNVVSLSNLSTLGDIHFAPHEPEKILDHRTIVQRYKVKWKDRLEEDNTWETEETLRKHFPTFPFQECN